MGNPVDKIDMIKKCLLEVIEENNLKCYGYNMEEVLTVYSADLCSILLNIYPGATIMINKNFRSCGLLISGKVYDAYGLSDNSKYYIAQEHEIGYIVKSFNQMSAPVMECLLEKLNEKNINLENSILVLRKNNENIV